MVTSPGAAQDEPPGAVFLSSSTNDSRLSQCAVRRWLYDRFVRNFRNFLNSGFTATLWALIKRYWPSLRKAAHCRAHLPKCGRSLRCPKRNKLQNESVEARPCRYWGPQDYRCHSQAPRPQSLVGWGTCQTQRPEMTIESLSVRKTSAWRRSTPSTRKAKAQESLSMKRRFRTSAWRRSTSSTRKAKAQLSQT